MSTKRHQPRQPAIRQMTRQLSGAAKSRYLRQLAEAAGAGLEVAARLDAGIVQVLVRDARGPSAVGRATGKRRVQPIATTPVVELEPAATAFAAAVAQPIAGVTRGTRPAGKSVKQGKSNTGQSAPAPEQVAAPATVQSAAALPPPQVTFNPYGFSAMAVLLKDGRPALEALLGKATSREQIVILAEAQSVRLDPKLLSDKTAKLDALRNAFIEAVAQRIAHRRAISAG